MAKIKYVGNGSIEFFIPSVPFSLKMKNGETIDRDLTDADKVVIKQLSGLGLKITESKKKKAAKEEAPVEAEPVVEVQEDPVPVVEEAKPTKESLMALKAVELRAKVDALGKNSEGLTKSELADIILEA